jgi:hypothetical protein
MKIFSYTLIVFSCFAILSSCKQNSKETVSAPQVVETTKAEVKVPVQKEDYTQFYSELGTKETQPLADKILANKKIIDAMSSSNGEKSVSAPTEITETQSRIERTFYECVKMNFHLSRKEQEKGGNAADLKKERDLVAVKLKDLEKLMKEFEITISKAKTSTPQLQ